jgi:hypothetical protein
VTLDCDLLAPPLFLSLSLSLSLSFSPSCFLSILFYLLLSFVSFNIAKLLKLLQLTITTTKDSFNKKNSILFYSILFNYEPVDAIHAAHMLSTSREAPSRRNSALPRRRTYSSGSACDSMDSYRSIVV